MSHDIFDVLDVSRCEDTYTRLLVKVLNTSPSIRAQTFTKLTGKALLDDPTEAQFRKGLGERKEKNRPDIVMEGNTPDGKWCLVIEVKLMSGEGWKQTDRYLSACETLKQKGRCAGFKMVYLTLGGGNPAAEGWTIMTHLELADIISAHDPKGMLRTDPILAQPWNAYIERLRGLARLSLPEGETRVMDWLREERGFITVKELCQKLASALLPESWAPWGDSYTARGRQQCLVGAQRPYWTTGRYSEGQKKPLEECVNVHYELDMPHPLDRCGSGPITCHLHCETEPYRTDAELEKIGNASRFRAFRDKMREALRRQLPAPGTDWRPGRGKKMQIARLDCPFSETTTVNQLADLLRVNFEGFRDTVSKAMIDAAKECNLSWWQSVESGMARDGSSGDEAVSPPHM